MILADTSALLAAFDPRDDDHDRAVRFIQNMRNPRELVVPDAAIAEVGYWMGERVAVRAEAAMLRRFAGGAWPLEHFEPTDLLRAADLVEQYADFPLGSIDALIVAMAERLEVTTIFTLDRRHFGAVKPTHCEGFELVP